MQGERGNPIFEYQKRSRFFAQTQRLLEPIASEELTEIGVQWCKESFCGVEFEASLPLLYNIIYCARTINRILAPLTSFSCPNEKHLYQRALNFPWRKLFDLNKTFAIIANVSNSQITHSQFAARRLKDAIVDRFKMDMGKRPNVNPQRPDILLNLNIQQNRAVISLDLSGESLHRRGYRVDSVVAPMQETLAASIIRLSQWNGEIPLLDPMCGSGTLLAEALMKYCQIPASFKRKRFGFYNLPDFNVEVWKDIKNQCDGSIRSCPKDLIKGCDINAQAVTATLTNLKQIPQGQLVAVKQADFRQIEHAKDQLLVFNPPYGIRLHEGERKNLQDMYRQIGDFLKQRCQGSTAYILCGDKELMKYFGLRISRRIPLYNGSIESRLVQIKVY